MVKAGALKTELKVLDTPNTLKAWHVFDAEAVFNNLGSTYKGLSQKEAAARLRKYGANVLLEEKKNDVLLEVLKDIRSPLNIVLFVAALLSFLVGNLVDGGVILAVIAIDTLTSFLVAKKADSALLALKTLSADKALVRRDNREMEILAKNLVLGDLVILRAGNKVPADLRLIKSSYLEADESLLTGESYPVRKTVAPLKEEVPMSERSNLLYSGSTVTAGKGEAIVVATGKDSFFGQLSFRIGTTVETDTPLEQQVALFSKQIAVAVLFLALVIAAVAVFRGIELFEAVVVAVATAVAVIPEGLPAITSIALAVGVHKMAKENAVVRRVMAVETLGSINRLAIDKTGTITENHLKVAAVFDATGRVPFSSSSGNYILRLASLAAEEQSLNAAEPLERAIAEKLIAEGERLDLLPFKSELPISGALINGEKERFLALKGAPETLLRRSRFALVNGRKTVLDANKRKEILALIEESSADSLRLIAIAKKEEKDQKESIRRTDLDDLIFVGLIGFSDPPRESAKQAIADISGAGIKVTMLTGDHRLTAHAIASKVNLKHDIIYQGRDLSVGSIDEKIEDDAIYARISPEDKFLLTKAWQESGDVVAVSGDGVNDAPALKQADVGIAMGFGSTDVAKQAADLILLDNDLKTFATAIKEGRTIYNNIRRAIVFLLSSNAGEIMIMVAALILGWQLPFLAAQILWINLVTDGTADIALALEPSHHSVLKEPPRDKKEPIVSAVLLRRIIVTAVVMTVMVLLVQAIYTSFGRSLEETRAAAFLMLSSIAVWHMFNCRSLEKSLRELTPVYKSPAVLLSAISSLFLTLLTLYLPSLREWFQVAPLPIEETILLILASLIIIPAIEWDKKHI